MLEKGCNPRLPYHNLKKDLVDIHPTQSNFKTILDKARHHSNRCMQYSFKYGKERWDKSHNPPELKVRDLVLESTLNFNKIKGQNQWKYSCAVPFMIRALYGLNYLQLELTGELIKKQPAFPESLIKPYSSSDKELFSLRNKSPLPIPPLAEGEEKKVLKFLKERRTRNKKGREYLVRYVNTAQEDEWLLEKYIYNSDKILRRFKNEIRPK
ncbi:hypothetical protein O181_016051 [Austropuccinia psidii MF-1]|uniref:Chromo domain-containing protein n=1 Tax=Austropuccinia psidii MF-1 TaxID=1389203 RepID=A0A9Q3GQN9_9BASI|nr:hypothetical protein [Austropuccinia psidii MF-1]